ncbi:MAG: DUF4383 domain-containing protein [Caldilineaceae bacterium]
MSLIRKFAWLYAAMFLFIAVMGYIPAFLDNQGLLFGLFSLELKDNLLHGGSALWAALAAARSTWAARFYFQLFGLVYFFDGVVGLLFGEAYLDFGIFFYGPQPYTWVHKIEANIPHILIGGLAILIGLVLSRKYKEPVYA